MNEMTNMAVAAEHTRSIVGPTILMGDGSYFDFLAPEASTMTLEDYAFALAYTCRFRGQTRSAGRRCFYGVAQHCTIMAVELLHAGYDDETALAGLMHESGEVPWGDVAGPAKPLIPGFKPQEKRCEAAINALFNVPAADADLIKRFDLRMLATEKRDLMPSAAGHEWSHTAGYEPFANLIVPYPHPDQAARNFILMFNWLSARVAGIVE